MKAFWVGVFSTLFSGVILLAIGYYFFTDRPGAPEVTGKELSVQITGEAVREIFWQFMRSKSDAVNIEKLTEDLRFNREFIVGMRVKSVEIQNIGNMVYPEVTLIAKGFAKSVMQQDEAVQIIDGDGERTLRLNPGEKIELLGLSDTSSWYNEGKFIVTVDKIGVPIENMTVDEGSLSYFIYSFIRVYPTTSFWIAAISGIVTLATLLVGILNVIGRYYPELRVKLADNGNIASAIALYDYFSTHEPERAEKIKNLLPTFQKRLPQ